MQSAAESAVAGGREGAQAWGAGRLWSGKDDAALRRLWGRKSASVIARKLGRSRNAVIGRAHRLELSRLKGLPRGHHGARS